MMTTKLTVLGAATVLAAACARPEREESHGEADVVAGTVYTVHDTTLDVSFDAAGVAEPMMRATLGTKLMGTVVEVLVREGDRVASGRVVARIDARDLAAKQTQVNASVADAEAVRREARAQAARIRALYDDSAATRSQLDAVETALARAEAGVGAARAAADELGVVTTYASVRAPFAGTITRRHADPGAFVAPGTPIVTMEDADRVRVRVSAAPDAVREVRRGQRVRVTIEGTATEAVIEGVVPASAGNLYAVNAIVDNRARRFLTGSAATMVLPLGRRAALVVPTVALRHEGDLVGVVVRTESGDATRWVRVVRTLGDVVEIGAGLRAGEQVVVPTAAALASPTVPRGGR